MKIGYVLVSWHAGEEYGSTDLQTLYSKLEDIRCHENSGGWYKLLKANYDERNGNMDFYKANPIKESEKLITVDDVKEVMLDWYLEEKGHLTDTYNITVYPWIDGVQHEVSLPFPEKLTLEFAGDLAERKINQYLKSHPNETVRHAVAHIESNQQTIKSIYLVEQSFTGRKIEAFRVEGLLDQLDEMISNGLEEGSFTVGLYKASFGEGLVAEYKDSDLLDYVRVNSIAELKRELKSRLTGVSESPMTRLDDVYEDFINSLKTKLAQHSAKKTLERTTEFNGSESDVKGVIYYYLTKDGYNLFYKNEEKGQSYFIGDATGSVIDLNKTTFNFAKYIMERGVAHPNNSTYDFDRYEKSKKAGEDWFEDVSSTSLTSVLLRNSNFGTYSDLVSYIEGIQKDPKGYLYSEIFIAYDRELKMLDIYDEVARVKRSKYVLFGSLTFILLDIFKTNQLSQLSESEVKRLIDERFTEVANRLAKK